MFNLNGIRVIENRFMTERIQTKFCKSKKKRVKKKFFKKYWREVPLQSYFLDKVNHIVYAHPAMVQQIKEQLEKENRNVREENNYNRQSACNSSFANMYTPRPYRYNKFNEHIPSGF